LETLVLLLKQFILPLVTTALVVGGLAGSHILLEARFKDRPERNLHRQLIMLGLTLFGLLLIVLSLPLGETLRGQVLSLIGIVLSAALALSSTTFLGNALAGIMLRTVRSFRMGDFIRVQDHFGRVSGRGLFHVEIQTENRDLTTLPNLFLATHPVKVTRASGTIVTSEVSLGYDVPRQQVEALLVEAAGAAGLEEPFVYLTRLGDFSVAYRVHGLLPEVKQFLSAGSRLNAMLLDTLHREGIEIVSPNFMNTRATGDKMFIPPRQEASEEKAPETDPEAIIFDKAEHAETLEEKKEQMKTIEATLGELEKSLAGAAEGEPRDRLQEKIGRCTAIRDRLKSHLEEASRQAERKE